MKKILLFSFLLFSFVASSQTSLDSVETYCLIVGTTKLLSQKVTVQVDFGEGINVWKPRNSMLKDTNTGKPLDFASMIDALNYMAAKGWQFVDAYAVTLSSSNVYHWLMRKRVPLTEIESK